jgi:hypothetical protein
VELWQPKEKNPEKSSFKMPKVLELRYCSMKHFLVSVYQVFSNKALGLKLALP